MIEARILTSNVQWAAFPAGWLHRGTLRTLRGGRQAGLSIATIKLFIALNLRIDADGAVNLTSKELIDLTRISSAAMTQAIRRLVGLNMMSVSRQHSTGSRYWIGIDDVWCRLPYANEPRLHHLIAAASTRNLALDCLKIYLIICANADAIHPCFEMTPTRMTSLTGIPSFRLPAAVAYLAQHQLISQAPPPSQEPLGWIGRLPLPVIDIDNRTRPELHSF